LKVTELRDLKIEDLLGRDPYSIVPDLMAKTIAEKTVLVTGCWRDLSAASYADKSSVEATKTHLLDVSEFRNLQLVRRLKTAFHTAMRLTLFP
jgi:FlaA1/EpsC-like NDP-sugar epimerase